LYVFRHYRYQSPGSRQQIQKQNYRTVLFLIFF
jgi:hypothetical protein